MRIGPKVLAASKPVEGRPPGAGYGSLHSTTRPGDGPNSGVANGLSADGVDVPTTAAGRAFGTTRAHGCWSPTASQPPRVVHRSCTGRVSTTRDHDERAGRSNTKSQLKAHEAISEGLAGPLCPNLKFSRRFPIRPAPGPGFKRTVTARRHAALGDPSVPRPGAGRGGRTDRTRQKRTCDRP